MCSILALLTPPRQDHAGSVEVAQSGIDRLPAGDRLELPTERQLVDHTGDHQSGYVARGIVPRSVLGASRTKLVAGSSVKPPGRMIVQARSVSRR